MSVRNFGRSFRFSKNTGDECLENRVLEIPYNWSSSGNNRNKKSAFWKQFTIVDYQNYENYFYSHKE